MSSTKTIAVLFTGSLFCQIVQLGAYPILLAQLLEAQNASGVVIGVFLSVSWVSVLIVGPFVPSLIRRFGYNRSNLTSGGISLAGLALVFYSETLPVLFISAALLGFGLIFRWIICDALAVQLSPEGNSGKLIGLHEALMGFGIAIGPLFFLVFNIADVAFACFAVVAFGHMLLWQVGVDAPVEVEKEAPSSRHSTLYLIMLAGLVCAFVAGFIENSSVALLPLYLDDWGFSLSVAAIMVSSFGLGGTLLQPGLGAIADRYDYTFAQSLCIVVIVLSCLGAVVFPTSFWLMLIFMFTLGGAAGGLNTLAVIQAGQTLTAKQIPTAMTAIAMVYTFGSVFGPVASGGLLEAASRGAMMWGFAGLAGLLGVFLATRTARTYFKAKA